MEPSHAFGQVLRELRKQQNVSQEHLADLTGLDRTFISLLERGERQPSLSTILLIARALNLAASELIRRVEVNLNENQEN